MFLEVKLWGTNQILYGPVTAYIDPSPQSYVDIDSSFNWLQYLDAATFAVNGTLELDINFQIQYETGGAYNQFSGFGELVQTGLPWLQNAMIMLQTHSCAQLGDVGGNGPLITPTDTSAASVIMDGGTIPEQYMCAMDMTCDGQVDVLDLPFYLQCADWQSDGGSDGNLDCLLYMQSIGYCL